jgi:beta-xylosidase
MKFPSKYTRPKKTKRDVGKSMTVQGEALSVKDLFRAHANGFPLPSARQELVIDLPLEELTEDTFDMPDLEEFRRLDPTERAMARNNLAALGQALKDKVAKRKADYDKVAAETAAEKAAVQKVEEEAAAVKAAKAASAGTT